MEKPKKTSRAGRLDVRVSPEEKELFERAAMVNGESVSNWLRRTLLAAARADIKRAEK